MLPRWLACVVPSARLIVTLRDPIERSYSDYYFFGRYAYSVREINDIHRTLASLLCKPLKLALLSPRMLSVDRSIGRSIAGCRRRVAAFPA